MTPGAITAVLANLKRAAKKAAPKKAAKKAAPKKGAKPAKRAPARRGRGGEEE